MRTIRVTGKSQIKLKPDLTRITLSLEECSPEYEEALQRSSQDTEKLQDLLTTFGFARSDLKTLNFGVDTEYESYQEQGVYKQRFIGYKYHHQMKLEFPLDNGRLGRVLYALAHCCVKPEFRISYTVKDPEAAKNELLDKAVQDAAQKAAVLTRAAGVVLGEIQSIDYSWGQVEFEVQPMNRMLTAKGVAMAAEESYDMNIEPDDIAAADTVTVLWEIA